LSTFDGSVSRRRVLGWAAGAAGVAAGAVVAGAPAAHATTAPAAAVPARAAAASSVREVLGSGRKNAVALTIDDGPHPTWTPKVLDLLAASGVRATFSLVGEQAQAYPKLVRRIARAGHGLCNHSMTHPQPFGARSTAAIRGEIRDAQSAISDAAGTEPELFRAPGGDWTAAVLDSAEEYGLTPVGWSVDPRDWAQPGAPAIKDTLLTASAGDILLCHDGGGNRAQTVTALKAVLPQLRAEGLRFVAL
jgi:peptidoglycan/xylan/chitin deacetylase (PgdA/CDA1 family)